MKWLGKGVLRYAKKSIAYGEDIPKGIIDEKALKKMISEGQVGDIPEKIKPGKMLDDAMAEIKILKDELSELADENESMAEKLLLSNDVMEENLRLTSVVEALELEKKVLTERVDVLEKDAGDFAALEKEVAKLKKKAGA